MTYEEAYLAPAMAEWSKDLPPDSASKGQKLPWVVYAIADERSPDRPFYVGVTSDFLASISRHNFDPESAAYSHAKYLDYLGIDCEATVVARFAFKDHAYQFESFLIATTPRLLNRDIRNHSRRLVMARTDSEA